jgi:uridine phosphorylase
MDLIPLTDYDPNPRAIIQPQKYDHGRPVPERGVLCFFFDLLAEMVAAGQLVQIGAENSEMGDHPFYVYTAEKPTGPQEVVVFHPGVGAPLAVGLTEGLVAQGVNRLIACGGCGVLRPEIAAGHPVILTAAVRDEGTSFHYLPPSREVGPHPAGVAALEAACKAAGIDYRLGKTWTTDGYFRETIDRRDKRLAEGCDVVDMEASAFFAMAQFRGVVIGQIVYGGDLVVPEGWDYRGWQERKDVRRLMFQLAVDAVLRL